MLRREAALWALKRVQPLQPLTLHLHCWGLLPATFPLPKMCRAKLQGEA